MSARVRKAVIPAAGLGTRCLPLTKAVPKELLPVWDRPGIERVADEAADSGCDTLVLITGRGKTAIEDHFDHHPFLESKLQGQAGLIQSVRNPERLQVVSVRQAEARGLGHAVGCARTAVGDEPFAVMLPDDLIWGGGRPALRTLIDVYEATGKGVVLLMEVPPDETSRYGIVRTETRSDGTLAILDMVEKPPPGQAPSNLAIIGRYVFPPSLFPLLEATPPGALGEIQLTDAMRVLAREEGLLGVLLDGVRMDTGSPLGLFRASLYYASDDPAAAATIREFARTLGP